MTKRKVMTPAEIEQRQAAPVTHGAESAIKSFAAGVPFSGLAKQAEDEVRAELETDGLYAIAETRAIRLQAICDLFYAALQKAADSGDLAAFERYTHRYAWLAGASTRAWAHVAELAREAAKQKAGVVDILKAIRGENDNTD